MPSGPVPASSCLPSVLSYTKTGLLVYGVGFFRIFALQLPIIMTVKAAVQSMRLRTLPLSVAGVLLGILLAVADWKVDPWTAVLIVLTTVCLQILSNLSNELGDVLRGTDTADRQGPQYGLNGGDMTVADMKKLIGLFVVLCMVSGAAMTWRAFGTLLDMTAILVLLLGAAAIAGAMKYTLGHNPYGYRAKGDFYVFLFFGLVAVMGAYFVCTRGLGLHWKLLLPRRTQPTASPWPSNWVPARRASTRRYSSAWDGPVWPLTASSAGPAGGTGSG